jgi:hypothetical protein
LFYALEYWEHTPAFALLVGSSALALRATRRAEARYVVVSGALGTLSTVLRPEAVSYLVGLGVMIGRRRWIGFGSGVAAILIPFAVANYLHSGTALGPHVSANLASLAENYLSARWHFIDTWLSPHSRVAALAFLLIGIGWISGLFNVELKTRQMICLVGVAAVSVLAAQRMLPRESLWQGFPLALLAFVPTASLAAPVRQLYVLALAAVAGTCFTLLNVRSIPLRGLRVASARCPAK